ncbi:MAG TPA: SMC family ATPase, partial [Armatimonadota bacterium]|nr:SMC family ATPase [Armatimonadota bacterium]
QSVALDRLAEERAVLQARLQELAAETAEAGAELRRCMEGLESADERFNLLKGARSVCPTCDGALPDEKRLELGRRLREEKAALKEAQGQAIQRQSDAKKKDTETRRALQELDGKLRTGQVMRDRLAQARQRHLQLAERTAELPAELEHAQGLEALLQSGEFAPEVTAALAEVSTRIKSLGYNERRQREIAGRLQELAGAERDLHALEAAETALPGELQEVQTLKASIQRSEEAIADDRAARAEADRELTRAPAVDAEAARLAAAVQKAETGEAVTSRALGAATETLARCEALGPQIQERKRERAAAAKDQALYEELAKAFGRNGIQALIIENALPEIEAEANALLGRMSDGQLSVRLKTQRELRAGGQAETLEIEISDSMGARRYELYSGGEAFRVNFAIRIALSKLLARRAGARLETLIIDEGFGSQDGDGRVRLVEAIHAVQDDFAKILVITHIDELKDAFPTRIEVTKGPLGSQVAVY